MKQELQWLLKEKYHWDMSRPDLPAGFVADLARLEAGEPLAYVIGWVNFLGCRIDLSLRPLIPRPETEFWVEEKIVAWKERKPFTVLDLCCGSGCIGIALLKHLPQVTVDFADSSGQALQQTRLNLEKNTIAQKRYAVIHSDLFTAVTKTYDVIVCNPPYVDPEGEVAPELRFEPSEALFAQNHGFALIEKIISEWKKYSRELVMEFGAGQEKKIEELCGADARFEKDQYRRPRVLLLLKNYSFPSSSSAFDR